MPGTPDGKPYAAVACAAVHGRPRPHYRNLDPYRVRPVSDRARDVAAKSPFTETYVRKLARENSIPEYLLRRYPKARAELEARLPRDGDGDRRAGHRPG